MIYQSSTKLYSGSVKEDSAAAGFFAFLLPVLSLYKVNLVGDLFLSEPLVIVLAVWFFLCGRRITNARGWALKLIFAAIFWLLMQIISDVINDTPILDRYRGVAKIAIFILNLYVLFVFLDRRSRVWWFFIGYAVAYAVRPFFDFGETNSIADESGFNLMWKFGIGFGLFLSFLAFSVVRFGGYGDCRRSAGVAAKFAFALGVLSFFFNARSLAGTLLVTAVLLIQFENSRAGDSSSGKILAAILGLFAAGQVLAGVYSVGAQSGFFGQQAQEKYEEQYGSADDGGGLLKLLGGGRSEFLVSSRAIADSPMFGHGSWAKRPEYTILYFALQKEKTDRSEGGGVDAALESHGGLIPSHSYLLGAWVESGFFGAFFWCLILYLMLFKALPGALNMGDFIGVISVAFMPITFWNIAFSPFGGHVKLSAAFVIFLVCLSSASGLTSANGSGVRNG